MKEKEIGRIHVPGHAAMPISWLDETKAGLEFRIAGCHSLHYLEEYLPKACLSVTALKADREKDELNVVCLVDDGETVYEDVCATIKLKPRAMQALRRMQA